MFKANSTKMLLVLIMIIFTMTGCGLYGPEETAEIDPPPLDLQQNAELTIDMNTTDIEDPEQNNFVQSEEEVKKVTLTIYFFDDKGDVVPLSMDIPKVEGIGQEVLKYMTIGGPGEELLPQGFEPVLPEGTKFTMNIKSENKLAIIDFSREFLSYDAQSAAEEKKILDAITWSMTEFPTIEQVEIRVNGFPLEAMPVFETPVVGPLSRLDGINLEFANNINIGQTTPVTLFFNRTSLDFNYLVPVTRLIPKTDNLAKATIEQLILGPKQGTNLTSSLLPTTKLLSVKVSDNMLVADFDDGILGFNNQISKELIDMLLWSLSENLHISAIQIKVKGETSLLPENLSKPVMKSDALNAVVF